MKMITSVLLSLLVISCGSDSESNSGLTFPANLDGLWNAERVDILDDNLGAFVVNDDFFYFYVDDISGDRGNVTVHFSTNDNCYDTSGGNLVRVGQSTYRDAAGDELTILLDNETLELVLEVDGDTWLIEMQKITNISVQDIPICS